MLSADFSAKIGERPFRGPLLVHIVTGLSAFGARYTGGQPYLSFEWRQLSVAGSIEFVVTAGKGDWMVKHACIAKS